MGNHLYYVFILIFNLSLRGIQLISLKKSHSREAKTNKKMIVG